MKQQIFKAVLSLSLASLAHCLGAQEYYPISEGQLFPKIKHKRDPAKYPNQSGCSATVNATSNAVGQTVPYVSYVMALQNFEDHPEQAANDRFFRSAA